MSHSASQQVERQVNTQAINAKATEAVKPSELQGYETSVSPSMQQMMMLQRKVGNQAVMQMVRQQNSKHPAQSLVIQRALKDADKVVWNNDKLSKLWVKMKDRSEGKDGIPGYADVKAGLAGYIGQSHTERELAEIIINTAPFKAMFQAPRQHQEDDVFVNPGGSIDDSIKAILRATIFYHVTYTKHVDAIYTGGIKASKGGKGEGISTHGREDADANATYNKWSRGHTFISKSKSEADGYYAKMNTAENPAKIIHVFSMPHFIKSEMKVDIDSKAGLKYEGDLNMIGDGSKLNAHAMRVIRQGLTLMKVEASDAEILGVYTAVYGG
ncbi:hypothetical protein AB4Z29_16815 [Paenibacillus sp. 2TAB23]|uniref:hypothetical protein n=1 Tax=Paenibacillus sp. 2TAB23 TaxID=3233004 RepID=UPI003F9D0DCD